MRRWIVAGLLAVETVVFCSIVAVSAQMSQDVARNCSVQRVAHVVAHATMHLAQRLSHTVVFNFRA